MSRHHFSFVEKYHFFWIFPDVKLKEEEKREILATVVAIAVQVLFETHLYTFGGKNFKQRKGGPIGLRATCALARLIMCKWDTIWKGVLGELKIQCELYIRNMDDGRIVLHPIRPGWRVENGNLVYTKKWEMVDMEMGASRTGQTAQVLEATMKNVMKGILVWQWGYPP